MTLLHKTVFICLALLAAACSAEPPRNFRARKQPLRQRFFARQELAPAPAPYPSADELKPAVPFEEVAPLPDQTYGPPDQTYGPPEADQLPSAEAPLEFAPNPDAEEFAPARFIASSRLRVNKKNTAARLRLQQRKIVVNSQRLVAAAAPVPASIVSTAAIVAAAEPAPIAAIPAHAQQFVVVNSPFAYTTQFQTW